MSDAGAATITGSRIVGNVVAFDDAKRTGGSSNAALQVGDSPLVLRDTVVTGNTTSEGSSILEWDGVATVSGLSVVSNRVTLHARHGAAVALGAVQVRGTEYNGYAPGPSTIVDSLVASNTTTVTSDDGPGS